MMRCRLEMEYEGGTKGPEGERWVDEWTHQWEVTASERQGEIEISVS